MALSTTTQQALRPAMSMMKNSGMGNMPTAIVYSLLCFQNQLRLFHWQTTSYAQHVAFGSTYDALDGMIDRFVETMIGLHGRPNAPQPIALIPIASDAGAAGSIAGFESFLLGLDQTFDCEVNSDLLNIRDEMLGTTRKLKYLLTLQ